MESDISALFMLLNSFALVLLVLGDVLWGFLGVAKKKNLLPQDKNVFMKKCLKVFKMFKIFNF